MPGLKPLHRGDFLLAVPLGCLWLFLIWRLTRFRFLKDNDRRCFAAFWLWPLAWFFWTNLIPSWHFSWFIFQLGKISLLAAILLDFIYYFGLKTTDRVRGQVWAGTLLLPFLLLYFWPQWQSRNGINLNLPHSGKALVWTDALWQPDTYYFMVPESRPSSGEGPSFQDPNFGRPVFSPISGTVTGVTEAGFIEIEEGTLKLSLGPMVPASIRLGPGDPVVANLPLGLLDRSGGIPGIQLQVVSGQSVRFQDLVAGDWLAKAHTSTPIKRNQWTESVSPTRFKLGN